MPLAIQLLSLFELLFLMGNSIKRKRVDGLCGPFAAYDEQSEVNKAKEDSPAQPIIPIQSINPTQQRLIDGWNEWGWNE